MRRSGPNDIIKGYNSLSDAYMWARALLAGFFMAWLGLAGLRGFYVGEWLAGLELCTLAFLVQAWAMLFLPANNRVRMRNTWINSWMNK